MQYPARFEPDLEAGGYVVTFRDIPEAITQGDDDAEAMAMAMAMAEDVLISSMDFYFEDRRIVPSPSTALPNERMVALPASVAVKVLLQNEMLAQKVGPSELARRLGSVP